MNCTKKYCTRKGGRRSGLCPRHRVEKWRKDNPVRYAFITLADNAKRRGKPFEISFEYFTEFCTKTKYIQGKGKTKESFTIDRKDETIGYVEGNLQLLSNSDNVKKMLKYSFDHRDVPCDFHVVTFKQLPHDPSVPY